jgi:hypothetical protein
MPLEVCPSAIENVSFSFMYHTTCYPTGQSLLQCCST